MGGVMSVEVNNQMMVKMMVKIHDFINEFQTISILSMNFRQFHLAI